MSSSSDARMPWSDAETWALIQAWGPIYHGRNGGSLHAAEWREVCSAVNAHRAAVGAGCRFNRSLVQCQRRVYNLKYQYQKELAKHGPSGWRHFAKLRAFLAGPDNRPPPGFAAKMPMPFVKEESMVEVEEEASGSVGRRTVPDILDRSGGPPPGFAAKMPASVKKEKQEVKEEVGGEGPANGATSAGWCPAKVAMELAGALTNLAGMYERVEMERLSVEREKIAIESGRRACREPPRWRPRIWENLTTTNRPTLGELATGFNLPGRWATTENVLAYEG